MTLPDRTLADTPAEHLADHNTLHDFYNDHPADPAAHSGTYVPLSGDTTMTGRLRNSKATRDALHIDQLGLFTDQKAHVTLRTRDDAPSGGLTTALFVYTDGHGDNTTFIGNAAASFTAADSPSATISNKGVLYGLSLHVAPLFERDNVPHDDATPLLIGNSGTERGTDALYFEHNDELSEDFANIIQCDASGDNFIRSIGTHEVGLSLSGATCSVAAIRLANTQKISWIAGDGSTLTEAVQLTDDDRLRLYNGKVNILSNGGVLVANSTATPSATANAVVLYVEAGVLKAKTPSGAITVLAS